MGFFACSPSRQITTPTYAQPKAPIPSPMEDPTHVRAPVSMTKTDVFMEDLLKSRPEYFDSILTNRTAWKVQVIYTQIDRQGDNSPLFKTYYFNYDPAEYIYPASTVKMPIALLALQKLHELRLPGLDRNSTMITEAAYNKQSPVYNDPSTTDGRPSVANYVKKIFMVSDNDAFNRLYEFLGQQYINDWLHKMGFGSAEIMHRLEISMTADENRHSNPIKFLDPSGKTLYSQPMQFNETIYSKRNDAMGKGYYRGDSLVNHPMDFSGKNRLSLEDLTGILKSILFPSAVPEKQRFNITDDDYQFVRKYMSQLPTESKFPPYSADTASYWPAFCKFLLFGSEKRELPKNIRIFNKIGDAYGCLTDVAYVVDYDKKIEFMLSARLYCNVDGILNDDKYDYDNIGFPFMKYLGQVLYDYELKRQHTRTPDLGSFKFTYDK